MHARFAAAVLIALLLPAVAAATPPKGYSVLIGSGSHSNETVVSGTPHTYDSGGLALGFDVQLPVGESLSANVQYLLWLDSSRVTDQAPYAATVMESVLALQGRFWPTEAMFFGAHLGLYQQAIVFDNLLLQPEDGMGLGYGFSGGLEVEVNAKTRLTLSAQYDRVPSMGVIAGAASTDLSGFTLLLGMRFVP